MQFRTSSTLLASLATLALLATPARAEHDEPDDAKSPGTATALAVGGTLLPAAAIALGFSVVDDNPGLGSLAITTGTIGLGLGPSAGHWYAGKSVTGGLGLRVLGAAVAGAGAMKAMDDCFLETQPCSSVGDSIMVAGAAVFVGGVVWDIATADNAARDWNRRHGVSVSVAPTVTDRSAGITLVGAF